MKKHHPQYNIKKHDTLQSITGQFCVEEEIWTRYHNNMCPLDDVIRQGIPEHLTEIYLLPELWDKESELNFVPVVSRHNDSGSGKSKEKIHFGYENTLIMKYCPQVLHYEVMINIFKSQKVNTIRNEYAIRWVGKEEEKHIIEIDRTADTQINDREADLLAEELAVKVSAALYPLQLVVTREDGIIDIFNFSQIQKRWEDVKRNLRDYYSGEVLEKYLRLNDLVMTDSEVLFRSLQNDWFLHVYFNKIYETYGSAYSLSNTIYVPFVFDAEGVAYDIDQTIDNQIDENGYINIRMAGKFSDERSLSDLEDHLSFARDECDTPVEGKYVAQYILEPEYNTIVELTLHSSLKLEKQKDVSVAVTRIKKQSYE